MRTPYLQPQIQYENKFANSYVELKKNNAKSLSRNEPNPRRENLRRILSRELVVSLTEKIKPKPRKLLMIDGERKHAEEEKDLFGGERVLWRRKKHTLHTYRRFIYIFLICFTNLITVSPDKIIIKRN